VAYFASATGLFRPIQAWQWSSFDDELGSLGIEPARGHISEMAKSTARLLEVAVSSSAPTRWKWSVSEGPTEIACGYETSRETAQKEGDSALFALLSIDRR
jgi:hypothetical protein